MDFFLRTSRIGAGDLNVWNYFWLRHTSHVTTNPAHSLHTRLIRLTCSAVSWTPSGSVLGFPSVPFLKYTRALTVSSKIYSAHNHGGALISTNNNLCSSFNSNATQSDGDAAVAQLPHTGSARAQLRTLFEEDFRSRGSITQSAEQNAALLVRKPGVGTARRSGCTGWRLIIFCYAQVWRQVTGYSVTRCCAMRHVSHSICS